jgi:hypothetical protein
MKRNMKNYKNWLAGAVITLLLCAAFLPALLTQVAAQPGDAADPLVTRRYVGERVDPIWAEIQTLRAENAALRALVEGGGSTGLPAQGENNIDISALRAEIFGEVMEAVEAYLATLDPSHAPQDPDAPTPPPEITDRELEFTTINVSYNQVLTLENGAEAILRNGTAIIVADGNVGLVDMTAGRDIRAGESVPRNHLLIAPRTDGRGLRFTAASSWVMVRGGFSLE